LKIGKNHIRCIQGIAPNSSPGIKFYFPLHRAKGRLQSRLLENRNLSCESEFNHACAQKASIYSHFIKIKGIMRKYAGRVNSFTMKEILPCQGLRQARMMREGNPQAEPIALIACVSLPTQILSENYFHFIGPISYKFSLYDWWL